MNAVEEIYVSDSDILSTLSVAITNTHENEPLPPFKNEVDALLAKYGCVDFLSQNRR